MNKKQKELAIEVKGITKSYPGVVANKSVDFTVNKGEICLLYTSPSPRDRQKARKPSSA